MDFYDARVFVWDAAENQPRKRQTSNNNAGEWPIYFKNHMVEGH